MSTRSDGDRRAALFAATLSSFLTPFMGAAVTVALPEIGRAFALDALLLGWIPTSYLLAAAVFLVPFGRVADIAGRKKVFVLGIGLFTAASLLCGMAVSGPMLIAARVLQGIGSAMIFGTGVAILTSVFPAGERGRVLGINTAAVYAGLSVGPTVGGVLTRALGWRSIFLVNVPLGLLVIVLVCLWLKGEWRSGRGGFDWPGSALYGASLIGLMVGFSKLPGWIGAALLGAGLLGLVAFGWWEAHSPQPVIDLRLFRSNRPFTFSSLAALINYSATSAVTFLVSLYLQYVKALSPQQAGWVLVAQPIVMAALSPLAGRLSDRLEPRLVASIGMAVTAVGLALLIPVEQGSPLWTIVARLVILGCGFGLFSSPNMNAIMSSVDRSSYGVASAIAGTMRLVGQMLSMGIVMLLFGLFIGRVEITASVHPQFLMSARAAFGIFTALCVAGTFASLARGRIR